MTGVFIYEYVPTEEMFAHNAELSGDQRESEPQANLNDLLYFGVNYEESTVDRFQR